MEARARAEANALVDSCRMRLSEECERSYKLALALERRPVTVWLQVVAIVLIIVGIAVASASWREEARRLIGIGEQYTDVMKAVIDTSSSTYPKWCFSGETRWRERSDGSCHLEDAPAVVTTAAAASTSPAWHPDFRAVPHELEISTSEPCWLRVSEITPAVKLLTEGQEPTAYKRTFSFDEKTTLEVRSGCPGSVLYKVNGQYVTPTNVSKTPDKSEVAEILL